MHFVFGPSRQSADTPTPTSFGADVARSCGGDAWVGTRPVILLGVTRNHRSGGGAARRLRGPAQLAGARRAGPALVDHRLVHSRGAHRRVRPRPLSPHVRQGVGRQGRQSHLHLGTVQGALQRRESGQGVAARVVPESLQHQDLDDVAQAAPTLRGYEQAVQESEGRAQGRAFLVALGLRA